MRLLLRLALVLTAALAGGAHAQTCTTTWTNTAGGTWSTAANWSDGVPTAGSVACITTPGTYTVTSAGLTVGTLRLGAATGTQTLVSNGPMSPTDSVVVAPTGVVEWRADYLHSGTLTNRGLVRIAGGANSRGVAGGATFRNEARVEWSDIGNMYLGGGARIENVSAFDVSGTGVLYATTGSGTLVNEAAGTLTKSGTGTFAIGVPVTNAGTVAVAGGATLSMTAPTSHTSPAFVVGAGGTLAFSAVLTLAGTTTGAPAGRLVTSGGIEAPSGAVVTLGGTGLEWAADYLRSGTLTNRGLVRIAGGANSRGVAGGATFRNEARVEWSEEGNMYLGGGARIENIAMLDVSGTGVLYATTGSGTLANEAAGTLTKSGAGAFAIGVPVTNAGTVAVAGGATLSMTAPTSHTSPAFVVGAGGTLAFSAVLTLAGTVTGAPVGRLVTSGGIEAPSGAVVTLGGTGLEWTADYLRSGTLTNRGLLRLTTGVNSRGVAGGATFRNEARVEWSDIGNMYLGGGARIENMATLGILGTGGLYATTGSGTLVNEAGGTLTKSGAGAFAIGVPVTNAGTVAVGAGGGSLTLTAATSHTSPVFAVGAGGTLAFSAVLTLAGTTTGAPAGRLVTSGGIEASGTAVVDLDGTGLEWAADYLRSGTLTNRGLLRLTTGVNSRGVAGGATFRNEARVEWSDIGNMYLGGGARIENIAMLDVSGTGVLYATTGSGTLVNEAGGTLTKSGAGAFAIGVPVTNAGTVAVGAGGGTLSMTAATSHASPVFSVAEAGTLAFSGPLTLSGAATGTPAGRLVVSNTITATGTAELLVNGTGVEWTANYLVAGRLVNRGLVRLAGTTTSRGAQGADVVFRNEGRIAWTDGGQFYVYGGARFENAAEIVVTGAGGLRGLTGTGTFANETTATFVRSGTGMFTIGTGTSSSFVPLTVVFDGTVRLEGAVTALRTTTTNRSDFYVGAVPGAAATLTWTGDFPLDAGGELHLDLAGTAPGTGYDQIVLVASQQPFFRGDAALNGTVTVALGGGYVPAAGAVFEVLKARALTGGLSALTSLTLEGAGRTLYPSVVDGDYVLTAAEGIPTVSGPLVAAPVQAVNGRPVTLALTGAGFAPDLTVALECLSCDDPAAFGTVAGRFLAMTATAFGATFDLTPGGIVGQYEVVVRDPRGGVSRTPFTVSEGPPVLSVAVLDGGASEVGRRPGLFVIRSNRRLRSPLAVPFRYSGSAVLFTDYMTDVLGRSVTIPAGADSLVLAVFPLNDALTESAETVTLQLLYTGEIGTGVATLSIADGPPEAAFAVYASSPAGGGNVGPATITVGGQGFTPDAAVSLAGGAGPLVGRGVIVNEAGTFVEATFDLTDQPLGLRSVVVRNGTGEEATRPDAFAVQPGIYPDVFVQVLAPTRVPRTRIRDYTVLVRNGGNVNVIGFPSLAGIPAGTDWTLEGATAQLPNGTEVLWSTVAPTYTTDLGLVVALPSVQLGPGETREFHVQTAIATPQTLRLVGAWTYSR